MSDWLLDHERRQEERDDRLAEARARNEQAKQLSELIADVDPRGVCNRDELAYRLVQRGVRLP